MTPRQPGAKPFATMAASDARPPRQSRRAWRPACPIVARFMFAFLAS
ncbi:hypothetical protein [Burkholderia ubonensis]|nr:hypothetical protein [Burkholderia ubonensis]